MDEQSINKNELNESEKQNKKMLSINSEEKYIDNEQIRCWYDIEKNRYIEPITDYKFRILTHIDELSFYKADRCAHKRKFNIYYDMNLNIYLSEIKTIIICNYITIPQLALYLIDNELLNKTKYFYVDGEIQQGEQLELFDSYIHDLIKSYNKNELVKNSTFINILKFIDYDNIIKPLKSYLNEQKKVGIYGFCNEIKRATQLITEQQILYKNILTHN